MSTDHWTMSASIIMKYKLLENEFSILYVAPGRSL